MAASPGAHGSGRLVLVSHRVPVPGGAPVASGLVTALQPAAAAHGALWLGWSGRLVAPGRRRLALRACGGIQHALLDLTPRENHGHYTGFCNQALWPLLHGLTERVHLQPGARAAYLAVNRLFARTLAPLLRADDRVWIHDYHLIPLAAALRALNVRNRLGFFLHTPCPTARAWHRLPSGAALLRSLRACDLIGVQTRDDAARLRSALPPAGAGGHAARGAGRVGVFPASIATRHVARLAASVARRDGNDAAACRPQRALVLGVDRLDPTKGVAQRMAGFEAFLSCHGQYRERVELLQVLPDSRSAVPHYRALRARLDAQAAALNRLHGLPGWTPVRTQQRCADPAALVALYRRARVALVTPLRDGMNLVAKEYVAAQAAEDPGVLVLSRHAGAAHELHGALLVEPSDAQDVARALARALSLPLVARQRRWQSMYRHLLQHDAVAWGTDFLRALDAVPQPLPSRASRYDEGSLAPS